MEARSFIGSNMERAARRVAVVGNGHQRLVAQFFEPQGVVVEDLASGRQLDGFARPVEKAIAVFLLQLANLCADRRLRTKNFLSGTREAALPGNL
ncbi:MAG: hypothetical protein ABSA78_09615 [Candidatus Sulfotelmatobacter sp.]